MRPQLIWEFDGKTYMSVKAAHDKWVDVSSNEITAACKDKRIVGVIQDPEGHYYIPVEAKRPMTPENIRTVLIATISLKNRPDDVTTITHTKGLREMYTYLSRIDMIEPFDINDENRIPYDVIITDKGMDYMLSGNFFRNINWETVLMNVISIAGSIASIWGIIA